MAPHSDGRQSTQGCKVNLAGSRAVLQTEFLVTAGTATGEAQQRSETASEPGIVLKGPDGAMVRVELGTVMGEHKPTQPPLSPDTQ